MRTEVGGDSGSSRVVGGQAVIGGGNKVSLYVGGPHVRTVSLTFLSLVPVLSQKSEIKTSHGEQPVGAVARVSGRRTRVPLL